MPTTLVRTFPAWPILFFKPTPNGSKMPLEPLQKEIVAILKFRRSPKSFVGGSSVFNEHFPQISDDIDIYAEDVEVTTIAKLDVEALQKAGLTHLNGPVVRLCRRSDNSCNELPAIEWLKLRMDGARSPKVLSDPAQQDLWMEPSIKPTLSFKSSSQLQPARNHDALDILLIDTHYAPLASVSTRGARQTRKRLFCN